MKTKSQTTFKLAAISLALMAGLTINVANAESADGFQDDSKMVDASQLIDWSQKVNRQLTDTLDKQLTAQLSGQQAAPQLVLASNKQYTTANLVLAGNPIQNVGVAPLSSIPVVILTQPKEDCLLNL